MERERVWIVLWRAGVVVCSLAFFLFVLWPHLLIHDWFLWQFKRSYVSIAHPPATRGIRTYSKLGLLVANGNHCDLFVGELRSYSGSRQDILDWYAARRLSSQLARGEQVPADIVFVEKTQAVNGTNISEYFDPLETIITDGQALFPAAPPLYIVFYLDSTGYDAGIDIRCM